MSAYWIKAVVGSFLIIFFWKARNTTFLPTSLPSGMRHRFSIHLMLRSALVSFFLDLLFDWHQSSGSHGALIIATGRGLTDSPLYKD